MKALITGASSGIGRDMAKILSNMGYDIIAVARDETNLNILKEELHTNVQVISMDLSNIDNCKKLYDITRNENIDVLINNAGFGEFGEFITTNLDKELNMIGTNISAVHILTKLFLQDMVKKDNGYILNVASIAGFMPGPLMATYYSTKAYVIRLSQSIYTELKKKKSKVSISVLCPGPVKTNFNKVAGVKFNINSMESKDVAKYGINKMFKRKLIIVPGILIKCARFLSKISPEKLVARVSYHMQEKKDKTRG